MTSRTHQIVLATGIVVFIGLVVSIAVPVRAPGTRHLTPPVAFGPMPDGSTFVWGYTLTNANGLEVRTIPYGAIIISIKVPDRNGHIDDIVIGHDSMDGYVNHSRWFGAVVGRYGNRIAKGHFSLDGVEYTLATNNGPNHLHGGVNGFDKKMWEILPASERSQVRYHLVSPDGDEGYPGRLDGLVTYALSDANELRIDYEATTDKPTPINLTNHTYFNLAGDGSRDVLDHVVTLHAARFTPVDATKIPTGELAMVAGTPFDFLAPTRIGDRIDANDSQITIGGGYDHNFVLDRTGSGLEWAARVSEPSTGRTLEVLTTEPGLQLNTANALDGTITGKSGHVYKKRYGLCLETQHFPDSPNHPNFPSTILRPGETFHSTTVWRFGVMK